MNVEMGIDVRAIPAGKVEEIEDDNIFFSQNKKGKGKLYPGGPTCMFKGVKVPCYTRWSESGGITSEILKSCLETMDHYNIFDHSNGANPVLIVDRHGSRLKDIFLDYINGVNKWCICVGVPYGTAYWQLVNSKEQKGSFNIVMTKKCSIVEKWR